MAKCSLMHVHVLIMNILSSDHGGMGGILMNFLVHYMTTYDYPLLGSRVMHNPIIYMLIKFTRTPPRSHGLKIKTFMMNP